MAAPILRRPKAKPNAATAPSPPNCCPANAFTDLADGQAHVDRWRQVDHLARLHQALGLAVPARRYHVSPRPYPVALPPLEYGPDDPGRRVQQPIAQLDFRTPQEDACCVPHVSGPYRRGGRSEGALGMPS